MTTATEQLEANKKLARDYIDQVFNQHNPSKATGDVVWHGNSLGDIAGAENLIGLLGLFIGRCHLRATASARGAGLVL